MPELLVCAWLAWCLLNVALFFAGPFIPGAGICTNGLVTVFPRHLKDILSAEQQAALLAHEKGHAVHRHALKNACRNMLFLFRTKEQALRQEHEADDYAAALGHGPALASALRVLSCNYFDRQRAARLDAR